MANENVFNMVLRLLGFDLFRFIAWYLLQHTVSTSDALLAIIF